MTSNGGVINTCIFFICLITGYSHVLPSYLILSCTFEPMDTKLENVLAAKKTIFKKSSFLRYITHTFSLLAVLYVTVF